MYSRNYEILFNYDDCATKDDPSQFIGILAPVWKIFCTRAYCEYYELAYLQTAVYVVGRLEQRNLCGTNA
jgi:hypothetical protein